MASLFESLLCAYHCAKDVDTRKHKTGSAFKELSVVKETNV